ncbi:hypothetical protein D3C72_1751460 [compost metagenome]
MPAKAPSRARKPAKAARAPASWAISRLPSMPMTSASQMKPRAKPSPSSLSPRQPVQPNQAMAGKRASQMRGSMASTEASPCHHTRAPTTANSARAMPLSASCSAMAGTSRHSGSHCHALTGRP